MFRFALSALLVASIAGCTDSPAGPHQYSAADIAGEYELVQVYGLPLPAPSSARTTVYSGHLSLRATQQFTRIGRVETCLVTNPTCSTDSATTNGVWVILQGGGLMFNDGLSAAWPVPRIEADGREIRFYTDGIVAPRELYKRQ